MKIKIKKLHPDAVIPKYATEGSACFDLHSVQNDAVWESELIDTGLAFEIPENHVMLMFSRSGHGIKNGVRLANCVGVIDQDYRNSVKVALRNDCVIGKFIVKKGDRIAQAMVIPIQQVSFEEVEELSETNRGTGGFGSTGS